MISRRAIPSLGGKRQRAPASVSLSTFLPRYWVAANRRKGSSVCIVVRIKKAGHGWPIWPYLFCCCWPSFPLFGQSRQSLIVSLAVIRHQMAVIGFVNTSALVALPCLTAIPAIRIVN